MTTPKIFKSQTLDFGPAMPLKLSKKPTENEPHVAKMRWFNLGSWTAVVTVRQLLHRNNPWGGLPCSEAGSNGPHGDQVGCLPCSGDNESKQSCTKRGLVYETICLDCEKEAKMKESRGEVGLSYKYAGTTHGCLRRRGGQHLADLKAGLEEKLGDKTSHMLIHLRESHPGENPRPRWGMKMIKTYTTTFKRLLAELVHIKYLARDPTVVLLNQKCGGYQGYNLPRLSVQNEWGGGG